MMTFGRGKEAEMTNQFGVLLKKLRKQKRLSQGKLGKSVDVHYNHIGRYERGDSYPSVPVLIRLSRVLDVTMDELINGLKKEDEEIDETKSVEEVSKQQTPAKEGGRLSRLIMEACELAPEDQAVVAALIEAFVLKKKVKELL